MKIARWREKYDQIPEDTKDPGLLKAKKALKKKMPTRRANEQYWNEAQFEKLRAAPPGKLYSRGPLPWRLLAYMLDASPEVDLIRRLVGKRLMDPGQLEAGPEGARPDADDAVAGRLRDARARSRRRTTNWPRPSGRRAPKKAKPRRSGWSSRFGFAEKPSRRAEPPPVQAAVRPPHARTCRSCSLFRGINPLYAVFLVNQLGIADRNERIQAMESVLELPRSVGHFVRVPRQDEMPPGPLATHAARPAAAATRPGHAGGAVAQRAEGRRRAATAAASTTRSRKWVLTLADKLRRLFDYDFPGVHDLRTSPVWAAGELLEFGGDFNKYVTSKSLQKQEGMVFRHLLAADPAGGRVHAALPARHDRGRVARRPGRHRRAADRKLPPRRSQQHRQGPRAGRPRRRRYDRGRVGRCRTPLSRFPSPAGTSADELVGLGAVGGLEGRRVPLELLAHAKGHVAQQVVLDQHARVVEVAERRRARSCRRGSTPGDGPSDGGIDGSGGWKSLNLSSGSRIRLP